MYLHIHIYMHYLLIVYKMCIPLYYVLFCIILPYIFTYMYVSVFFIVSFFIKYAATCVSTCISIGVLYYSIALYYVKHYILRTSTKIHNPCNIQTSK